jgi:hypothetical protein
MAATLSHSQHALRAQTTTPIHNAPTYDQGDRELHPTTPQPPSHDSTHHLPSITSALMNSEDHLAPGPIGSHSPHLAPGHLSPLNNNDNDSNMEGAEGTAGSTPLVINPWLQPVHRTFDGRVSLASSSHLELPWLSQSAASSLSNAVVHQRKSD